jgi:hypothetical protein
MMMPVCNPIVVTLSGDIKSIFEKAKRDVQSQGGSLTGDTNRGRFVNRSRFLEVLL